MRLLPFLIFILVSMLLSSCGEKLISRQDILDLLEDDGGAPGPSSSSSSNQSENTGNNTPISNSQNLDYYGLTNSPTGTTTGGASGSPAGANPTGR